MTLHIHRTGGSLLQALRDDTGAYYAIFGRSTRAPALLSSIERTARERSHARIDEIATVRTGGERRLREFFEHAGRADPEWRYAFTSRVLLAIPDYPAIALMFMLHEVRTTAPGVSVHALIGDDWQARLLAYRENGGVPPVFRRGGRRVLLRCARSAMRSVFASSPAGTRDVVIVTLGDSVAAGAADFYFGDLAAAIAQQCSVLTVYMAPGARVRFPKRPEAVPLEAFLSVADASASCRARVPHDAEVHMEPPDRAMVDYLRAREDHAGETAMQALMVRTFDRMLAKVKPRVVVYPFENRSWEKNLLAAARRHGVKRCVGYQHSSLTPRHLAFSGSAGTGAAQPLPDVIITCGEITARRVRAAMPDTAGRVIVGAALRARRLPVPAPAGWGVLAPISSSRAEAWEMLRTLHALCAHSAVPIVVRTHPSIPISDLYAQFAWPAHVQLSKGRTLAADLEAASLVVYSSSTVALEGMLYGRLPVYLDMGDVPSGNPIEGEHRFVFNARNGIELAGVIESIDALPYVRLAALQEEARAYAEHYLIEPTPAKVEHMAELIAAC